MRHFMMTTACSAALTLFAVAPVSAQQLPCGLRVSPHRSVELDHFGHQGTRTHVVTAFDSCFHGGYCTQGGRSYYLRTASASPVAIEFGAFSHVDDLASRLEFLSNELCLDLYYNYQHNPGFYETYAEAYHILEVAQFIHDSEHRSDREAIRRELGGLDALFHHVEDDVRGWSRHHRRQIGALGILTKMELMEGTLHHLMNDVGVAATEVAPPPSAFGGPEVAPPPSRLGFGR